MSIKHDLTDLKKDLKEISEMSNQKSFAIEMIGDYKKQNKRMFIIIIIILTMWFSTIGYLIYVLNDIGYEEITTETYDVTQDSGDNSNNNFVSGNGNEINNGKAKN